jgi:hypothetical protein
MNFFFLCKLNAFDTHTTIWEQNAIQAEACDLLQLTFANKVCQDVYTDI